MIETKDIVKMVKKIVRHDKGIPDTRIMHPMREWITGLVGVAIGVLVGSLFAFSVYQSYSASTTEVIVVTETVVPYKAALVEQALASYLEKRNVFEGIIGVSKLSPAEDVVMGTSTPPVVETKLATTSLEVSPVIEDAIDVSEGSEEAIVPDLAI